MIDCGMNKKDYQFVRQPEQVARAAEALRAALFVGFDTETTGLDPHTTRLRLIQLASAEACFVIDCFQFTKEQLAPILALLAAPQPVKVAHNAKFDAAFLMKHYGVRLGKVFDTMLASQLVSAGNEDDRHSLEMVVKRHLGWALDKEAQTSNWSGELGEYQLEYAALDAMVVLALREKLAERLKEMELEYVSQLEFDCVVPVAAMELAGVYLETKCWREQIARVRQKHAQVAEELQQALGGGATQMSLFATAPQINLDSPQQVKEALNRLGVKVDDTREWRLQKMAKQYPALGLLSEYRHLSKALSSYGENILEFINPATGRIHANFRQLGAPTGRMTCTQPSLQQIPHTPEYRSCFRAPEGRKLVVADYSQIELRILTDFARDPALMRAFNSGEDLHRTTAAQMLRVPLDEVTNEQREMAKRLNYGIIYGMGADGLAGILDIPVEEAGKMMDRYFATYSGIERWLRSAAEMAVREGRSRTASGRLWIYRFDTSDHQQLASLRRVAKNTPIQGTNSDILKLAIRLLDNALAGRDAQLINSIHDELVIECAATIAPEVARLVSDTMIAAAREFLKAVPVVVDAKVTDAWVKK
jgi:DNA polymerase I-like protein with 3'-5' exonuclease and polymerase domains